MPATKPDLFAFLDSLGLNHHTVDHAPIFTVEEGAEIKKTMPGGHSKNLFIKDKKGMLALVVAVSSTPVDLKILSKILKAKSRMSFGKPELMDEVLGITPGSVSPFAIMNDKDKRLDHVILDKAFFDYEKVWFHPLLNDASTAIAPQNLVDFVNACGHTPQIMDLANIELPEPA